MIGRINMKKIKFLAAILAVSFLVGCFSLPVGASDGIESYTSSASMNTEGALAKIETMDSVFGEGACLVLRVRPDGAIKVN